MRAVYEGLAEALLAVRPAELTVAHSDDVALRDAELNGWELAVEAVGAKLESLNRGFDKHRFLIAAGRIARLPP